jgi:hypothetical protein
MTGNKEKKVHALQWSEQSFYFTAHNCCQGTGTGFTGMLKIVANPQGQRTAVSHFPAFPPSNKISQLRNRPVILKHVERD